MGALDAPPAHAIRSLSWAFTEPRYNVPTSIAAKVRTNGRPLDFTSLLVPALDSALILHDAELKKPDVPKRLEPMERLERLEQFLRVGALKLSTPYF